MIARMIIAVRNWGNVPINVLVRFIIHNSTPFLSIIVIIFWGSP